MAEADHLLGLAAGEHVGEMADPEAHLGAEGGGEQFARRLGGVDRHRRRQAIVAIAAAFGRILAEMAEQQGAAAAGGLDEGGERVEPLALAGAARLGDFGLDPVARPREILGAPEQPGLGRIAVAAGAAGLLVKGLDRLGQAGMGDEADVRLVDAHPEGDGRDHHHILAADERPLVGGADPRVEPGMIGQGLAVRPRRAARPASRSCRGSWRRRCPGPADRRAGP